MRAASMCAVVLALGGCSIYFGEDEPSDAGVPSAEDADVMWPDAAVAACDPVNQVGCSRGDKCTSFADPNNPTQLATGCTPNGTVPLGGACNRDPILGTDDCVAGAWCDESQTCAAICNLSPDSCADGTACLAHGDVFTDRPGVGICEPECSLFAQNCPTGEACYMVLETGVSLCAAITAPGLTQGEICDSFTACARGYGCILNESPTNSTQLECAYFCNAGTPGGNPRCENGPGAGYACVSIRDFYSNTQNVPSWAGMCVDPNEWPVP